MQLIVNSTFGNRGLDRYAIRGIYIRQNLNNRNYKDLIINFKSGGSLEISYISEEELNFFAETILDNSENGTDSEIHIAAQVEYEKYP